MREDLIERLKLKLDVWRGTEFGDDICELLDEAAAALEAAREDAERLTYLATDGCVEGFVSVEPDIYDYACDVAEESGRDEPNDADMLGGIRRLIDAAIDQARGKENWNG